MSKTPQTEALRLADRTTTYHGPHAQAMARELRRLDAIEANAVAEITRQRTENAQLTAERDQLRTQLAKAVAEEREACAELCERIDLEYEGEDVQATWCASAIRARSNT